MSTHPHRPANPRSAFIVRWSALWGLFVALLTLVLSPLDRDGLQGGGADVQGAALTTALLAGPFLLSMVALRWHSTAATVTWLLCGLVRWAWGCRCLPAA